MTTVRTGASLAGVGARHAVGPGGRLVLNAEDPELFRHADAQGVPLAWFALDGSAERIRRRRQGGGDAAWLDAGTRLGLERQALGEGLRSFSGSPEENPGRANFFDLQGVRAIVDYAHNPHGCRALFDMVQALPAKRRLVVLGQAGDRTDDAILELARITWETRPDHIVVKELKPFLRGRAEGEVPNLIETELRRLGAESGVLSRAGSDREAVKAALPWAEPGDLLLLLVHSERAEVLALLEHLRREGWRPGDDLPV